MTCPEAPRKTVVTQYVHQKADEGRREFYVLMQIYNYSRSLPEFPFCSLNWSFRLSEGLLTDVTMLRGENLFFWLRGFRTNAHWVSGLESTCLNPSNYSSAEDVSYSRNNELFISAAPSDQCSGSTGKYEATNFTQTKQSEF